MIRNDNESDRLCDICIIQGKKCTFTLFLPPFWFVLGLVLGLALGLVLAVVIRLVLGLGLGLVFRLVLGLIFIFSGLSPLGGWHIST